MAELPDPGAIESLLDALAARPEGPLVQQLPREVGRRDSRWAQLFEELPESLSAAPLSAMPSNATASNATPAGVSAPSPVAGSPRTNTADLSERVDSLEAAVADLREQLARLRER
jgi:uncharacterized protein YceH (UPF0502 family)